MRNLILLILIGIVLCSFSQKKSVEFNEGSLPKRDTFYVFVDTKDTLVKKQYATDGHLCWYSFYYKDLIEKHNAKIHYQDSVDKARGVRTMWTPLGEPSIDFGTYGKPVVYKKKDYKHKLMNRFELRKYNFYYSVIYIVEEKDADLYEVQECNVLFRE